MGVEAKRVDRGMPCCSVVASDGVACGWADLGEGGSGAVAVGLLAANMTLQGCQKLHVDDHSFFVFLCYA
jgi:hypothetical protein